MAIVTLSLLGVLVWPGVSDADSLLGEFIRFGEIQVRRIPGVPPEGVPVEHVVTAPASVALGFSAIEPGNLPRDLVQVERSIPRADCLELLFRNQQGLAIQLTQSLAKSATLTVEPSDDQYIVQISGTNVLVLPDPGSDSVAAMFWEWDGIRFELLVTESWGGLPLAEAMTIVEALIAATS